MDAISTFNTVIKFIENSGLNFLIKKSPFSANVSIKSSFIKRFVEKPQNDTEKVVNGIDENTVEDFKKESDDRKKTSDSYKESIHALEEKVKGDATERNRLENILVKNKELIKDLENLLANQRSELLEVKSDKNKLKQKCKVLQEEVFDVRNENKGLKEELAKLDEVFRSKKVDVAKLNNEKINLEAKLKTTFAEQEVLKIDLKNKVMSRIEFKCNFCAKTFNGQAKLKDHVTEHLKDKYIQTKNEEVHDKSAQTENIEDEAYPCFYCGTIIKSCRELAMHKNVCNEETLTSFAPIFPCYQCPAHFENEIDLRQHYSR